MQVEFRSKTRCPAQRGVAFDGPVPFESPFAPSAVSTFTTNFLLVTVEKCYARIAT